MQKSLVKYEVKGRLSKKMKGLNINRNARCQERNIQNIRNGISPAGSLGQCSRCMTIVENINENGICSDCE